MQPSLHFTYKHDGDLTLAAAQRRLAHLENLLWVHSVPNETLYEQADAIARRHALRTPPWREIRPGREDEGSTERFPSTTYEAARAQVKRLRERFNRWQNPGGARIFQYEKKTTPTSPVRYVVRSLRYNSPFEIVVALTATGTATLAVQQIVRALAGSIEKANAARRDTAITNTVVAEERIKREIMAMEFARLKDKAALDQRYSVSVVKELEVESHRKLESAARALMDINEVKEAS